MPQNWKTYKIKDLCEKVSVGYVGPTAEYFTDASIGIPFLRSKNIRPGKIDLNDLAFVTKEFHAKNKKSQLQKGDIVIVRVGQNRGDVCKISSEFEEVNVANCVFLRPPQEYSDYLEAHLRSPQGQRLLLSVSSGSAQLVLNTTAIAELEVQLPGEAEAQEIAKIINSLDDKIELNLQMNKTLEEMAMTLYKHWFVDFGPFQNGKFVESELGMIPEGWEVKGLADISENHSKKRKPISTRERAKIPGKYPYYGATKILDHIDDYKFDGDYILVAEDGTVMTKNENPFLQYVHGQFWVSNHAHVLSGTDVYTNDFLYLALSNIYVIPYATGAVQLKINRKNLERMSFVVGPENVMNDFCQQVSSLYRQLEINNLEIDTLTKTRDTLLPKLISGEVRVKQADQELKNVL